MAIVSITSEAWRRAVAGPSEEQQRNWCLRLEAGDILLFPVSPVEIPAGDLRFLLGQQQSASSLHKNIAYKPGRDRLTGFDAKSMSPETLIKLHAVMRSYAGAAGEFLGDFLAPYDGRWELEYTSFRPLEEQARDLRLRRRNDLLHTDAFPTRPTYGARILRFFSNIHPTRTRDWITCEPFGSLVARYAPQQLALPRPFTSGKEKLHSFAGTLGLDRALPSLKRSSYDEFMLRFHNFLKENSSFQATCSKTYTQFPPGSSWIVYTDTVPHAVLAGQFALEQTLLVEADALVDPTSAPVAILEQLTGTRLR